MRAFDKDVLLLPHSRVGALSGTFEREFMIGILVVGVVGASGGRWKRDDDAWVCAS